MEELVKFTPGRDGEPGHFMSALPIKPYNIGTIRDNKETADMHNRSLVTKLWKNPSALEGVRKEMDKLISLGFIKKLKDLPKEVQEEINTDMKHYIPNTIAYKETSASTKVRICWDSSRTSKQSASLNSVLLKGAAEYSVVKMLIRFREDRYGISADITKFYNNLKLDPKHFRFHLANVASPLRS